MTTKQHSFDLVHKSVIFFFKIALLRSLRIVFRAKTNTQTPENQLPNIIKHLI